MDKIKTSEVKISDYNPRKISEKDFNNLKKSLKEFGILRPLIINKQTGTLISGHQMLKAAIELKIEELPMQYVDLSEAKERALNLAMNKISGEFEEDKLIELIQQITEKNEDVIGLTGFSTEEINYLLGLSQRDKEDIFATSQEDEFNQGNKYGIKEGDIIKLDDHTIICGDATIPEVWHKLLGDSKIDLVITSPPYNVGKDYSKYDDNKEFDQYFKMIEEVFKSAKDFIDKTRYVCVNIGKESGPINLMAEYHNIMKSLKYTFFRNIYWLKPYGTARPTFTWRNPFPRMYSPGLHTEIIEIYLNDEEMPKEFNSLITYKFGAGDDPRRHEHRKEDQFPKILLGKFAGNVWEMQPETTLGLHEGISHPAPFPTQLPFNCIRFFTFTGEKVIDPFMGSGSTMIASDQLNRKCYGIEIDPNYCSVAIERFLMYKPNAKLEIIHGNQ